MYQHDAPHGPATSSVPSRRASDQTVATAAKTAVAAIRRNGAKRMYLINEALTRARMHELWRQEHRHRRRTRFHSEVLRDVRRSRSR